MRLDIPRELFYTLFKFLTDVELARCSQLSQAHRIFTRESLRKRKIIAVRWRSVHIVIPGVRTLNPAPPYHRQVQLDELEDIQVRDYVTRYTQHIYLDDCKRIVFPCIPLNFTRGDITETVCVISVKVYSLQENEASPAGSVKIYHQVISFITNCKKSSCGGRDLESLVLGNAGHQLFNNILCVGFGHETADLNAIHELQNRLDIVATKPDLQWDMSDLDHLRAPIQVGPERLSDSCVQRRNRDDLPSFMIHVKKLVCPDHYLSPLEEQLVTLGIDDMDDYFVDYELSNLNYL